MAEDKMLLELDLYNLPQDLDPAANLTNSGWYILNNISATLFDLTDEQILKGYLAKSWQSFDGGKRYVVKIRNDAYFHDGNRLTTKDVVFSIKRKQILWPDYQLFDWIDPQNDSDAVKDLGNDEIEFNLKKPYDYFLFLLALPGTGIVPSYLYPIDKVFDAKKNPVLSGAYKVVEWKENDYLTLQLNDKWFGIKQGCPSKIIIHEKKYSEISERFLKKQTNFVIDTNGLVSSEFLKNPEVMSQVNSYFSNFNSVSFAYLNVNEGPFRDVKLRKYFSFILRNYLSELSLKSESRNKIVADEFYPPGYSGRTHNSVNYAFQGIDDFSRALKKNPVTIRLSVGLGFNQTEKSPFEIYLEKYGFNVVQVQSSSLQEEKENRSLGKNYDFGFWFMPLPPGDPCLIYRLDFGPDDFYVADPNGGMLYRMIEQVKDFGDSKSRIALARKINDYIDKETFIIPTIHGNLAIYSTKDFDLSQLSPWDFNFRFYNIRVRNQGVEKN